MVMDLIFVFVLALLVELLSHFKYLITDESNGVGVGLMVQILIYAHRVGLAYMVILAVNPPINVAVFVVAVGHGAVGWFFFRSRALKKGPPPPSDGKAADIPPMSC